MSRWFLIATLFLTGCLNWYSGPLPGEPKDESFKRVADTRVRYVDVGKGPAVVMLHGFASSLNNWDAVVPVLSKTHRVIALDLKGFGWSGRPEGDYSPAAQAKLVFALLDDLGVDKASVVAHSWGSSVALTMASTHPERVDRIALYDAWVYEDQIPTTFVWARAPVIGEMIFGLFYKERPDDKIEMAFYDKRYATQELVDHTAAVLDRPGTVAAALAAVRGQRFTELEKRYAKVTQPVLLLWGEDDVVTTVDVAYRLQQDLPNAKLITYGNCGHFPMIEAYYPSTRDLLDFLGEVER